MLSPEERDRLEHERDFLLASLRDLDEEMAAGDMDPADYGALKDSYTSRAADVLRRLSEGASPSLVPRSRRWVWILGSAVVAVVIAVLLVIASDERLPGQTMTGGSGDGSVSSLLVQARSLGMSDIPQVLDIYGRVLAIEPDNVEALTYFGWFSVLSAVQSDGGESAPQRLESGLLLLRQATITDPDYADAHCFLGISLFRFLDDAEAAQPEVDRCLASDPPAEVFGLVEGLAKEIAESQGNP
ncbi:MAG: hypothetical protein ACO3SP_05370 [Ilumatobacteraceae bacterium]